MSYPILAQTLSDHPSLQIFRSYSALNLKSILYYQAELAHLEVELADLERDDQSCGDPSSVRKEFAKSWRHLRFGNAVEEWHEYCCPRSGLGGGAAVPSSTSRRDVAELRQWKVLCRIRKVLDEYHNGLARQVEIENRYRIPQKRDLKTIRGWLTDIRLGKSFLSGTREAVWDPGKSFTDHITTVDTGDAFSNWLAGLLPWWKRIASNQADLEANKNQLRSPTLRSYRLLLTGLITVLASTLPVLPIVVLYYVRVLATRIALIFVFTGLAASVAAFGLQIDPDKVLAITTASVAVMAVLLSANSPRFAAVLVVFIAADRV